MAVGVPKARAESAHAREPLVPDRGTLRGTRSEYVRAEVLDTGLVAGRAVDDIDAVRSNPPRKLGFRPNIEGNNSLPQLGAH